MKREVIVESNEDSQLMAHAHRELALAGLLDEDSDYDGMIGECVLDLIAVLSSHGHSGGSAMETIEVFMRCALYQSLTPITSNPDEWFKPLTGGVEESADIDMWQSTRNPALFSYDGGRTWNSVDDPRWHQTFSPRAWLWRRHWTKLKERAGI